ncbi:lipolytic protein G-D-S-L [Candidatus Magnetobacterium bavaricum]|uniref:Lipolytic protein G-D-S-L n=1 Tax=Candidatus Magnetobacterium bavaricum TaxID=29290 RepID=A0A0F3GYI3_9BACT|nr:lipolytic protein G-D-S-L [Candidatus Magnetobacterium bavaricum]
MDKKRLVVAFGDSLTVGYQSPTYERPWYEETPYAEFLSKKLSDRINFITSGISGELTEEMLRRFPSDVISVKPDYVIILGGSNDLGWGMQPTVVMRNLHAMYTMAQKAGIVPIAVTVPSIRGYDTMIKPREILNSMIKKTAGRINIPCVDMFAKSAEPGTLRLAQQYSNDGLHLTTEGYMLLADLLYNEVFLNLQQ